MSLTQAGDEVKEFECDERERQEEITSNQPPEFVNEGTQLSSSSSNIHKILLLLARFFSTEVRKQWMREKSVCVLGGEMWTV